MNPVLDRIQLADVKYHLGLLAADETQDEQITGALERVAPLLLEDYFSTSEILKFSANQVERAVYGLSMLMAADLLNPMAISMGLNDSGSVKVGPLSVSNSSGPVLSSFQKRARELKREGALIMETLRLAIRGPFAWGAV